MPVTFGNNVNANNSRDAMIAGHEEQNGFKQPAGRPESVGYPCSSSRVRKKTA
jgi:hypothetical protein